MLGIQKSDDLTSLKQSVGEYIDCLQHGEKMINKAIDMFNEPNNSVFLAENARHNLRQSLRDGKIEAGEIVALSDDEASVARFARGVKAQLTAVRAKLLH